MKAASSRFSHEAGAMRRVGPQRGLDMPLFRGPPRLHGVQRSLTRRAIGASTVAVRLRQRPWPAVLADMIEGVVVVNALQGSAAYELRHALWSVLESDAVAA